MNPPLSLETAWDRLLAKITPLPSESVETDGAGGRVLSTDLVARRAHPFADLSAMDGFATSGNGPWQVVGESRAGDGHTAALEARQAVRISTGAAVPQGADAILPIEDAQVDGDKVAATSTPDSRFIRRKAFDFAVGEVLAPKGAYVTPPRIALARIAGYSRLAVARRPLVAIVECGDELAADPEDCAAGKIPAANGAMLAEMAKRAGAEVRRSPPVADDLAQLEATLRRHCDADLLITIGGASVGEHDLVKPALEALGATLDFWRVAIRPGKPLLVATAGRQLVVGLPGNPVSSFVTGWLFMVPAIRALMGAERPLPVPVNLPLNGTLEEGSKRREFRRAALTGNGVAPIAERDSSALRSLSLADLLIDRPANAPPAAADEMVSCFMLHGDPAA